MRARILPNEAWNRLDRTQLPPLLPFVSQENVSIAVVEEQEKVVGSLAVLRATHFEGLWMAPEYRGNPGVMRALLRLAMEQTKEQWVIGGASDDRMRDFLARVGGVLMPLDLYALWVGDKPCRQQ